jgi:ribosomal-protein-alanine N-acetyltransferase
MNAIAIRPMQPRDLARVVQIELDSYAMPWTEGTFRGLLRRRDADLLVAEANGRLVGYAASWSVLDQCELGNVAVEEDWRNRGIGAQLVRAVVERAIERGVREVFLEVRPSNPAAQHLYQNLGFKLVGRRKNYYLEPPEDALVMRLELTNSKRA